MKKLNPSEEIIGKIRSVRGMKNVRIVYKSSAQKKCFRCQAWIHPSERYTKAIGVHSPICAKCQPITGTIREVKTQVDTLEKFITSDDWFLSANGNAPDLVAEIIEGAGYESCAAIFRTKPSKCRSMVRMTQFRLAEINSLLAMRLVVLANEFLEKPL